MLDRDADESGGELSGVLSALASVCVVPTQAMVDLWLYEGSRGT